MAKLGLTKSIEQVIVEAIEEKVRLAFIDTRQKMIEEFTKQLDQERDKVVASTVLYLSRQMDIQTAGDRIIITILKEDRNANR